MSFYSGSARMIMVHICICDLLIVSVALGNVNVNTVLFEQTHCFCRGQEALRSVDGIFKSFLVNKAMVAN